MKVWFSVRTTIIITSACFFLGCSNQHTPSPEDVVLKYVNLLAKDDHSTAKELLTANSKIIYDELLRLGLHYPQTEITKDNIQCEVDGQVSSCTYCCGYKKSEVTLNLTRDDKKKWLILLHDIDDQKLDNQENNLLESQEQKLNEALEKLTEGD